MRGDIPPLGVLILQSDHHPLIHVDQDDEEDAGAKVKMKRFELPRVAWWLLADLWISCS